MSTSLLLPDSKSTETLIDNNVSNDNGVMSTYHREAFDGAKKSSKWGLTISTFSDDEKQLFLQTLRDHPRNVTLACRQTGISRRTYYYHMSSDPKFKEAVDELLESRLDNIEEKFISEGEKGKFLHGIAVLRAFRGKIWNPDQNIAVTHTIDVREAESKSRALGTVIDAELVKIEDEKK